MNLASKIVLEGEINLVSGLYIGGSYSPMAIGAPDQIVVRNPLTQEPYIPGSSLKGKIRSLLELSHKKIGPGIGNLQTGPSNDLTHSIGVLFGVAQDAHTENPLPSRLIARDGLLIPHSIDNSLTDLYLTETKAEAVICRVSSAATPRFFERVPANAKFSLNMVLNVFEGPITLKNLKSNNQVEIKVPETDLLGLLFEGFLLLNDDYLGGKGSRGSGQVEIKVTKIERRSAAFYRGEAASEDITSTLNIPEELRA